MGEGATEDKTTLAQKDIRFARTIQRLQRVLLSELEKVGIIHLYTLGYRGDDLLNFKLSLNNPSKIAEMQELEHWKTKFDIAGSATEGFFSRRWISEQLLGLSQDEYLRMQREMYTDKKFMAGLEAAASGGDAGGGDAGGGDLGGDLDLGGDTGGDDLGGDLDLGGDTGTDTGGDTGGTDVEPDLLAEPPAKRDDGRKTAGKSKHFANLVRGGEVRGSTKRTTFPGGYGYGGMNSLAQGMMESNQFEEDKLFSIGSEIKNLLESLNLKGEEDETQ
jgi:hypothetical protein